MLANCTKKMLYVVIGLVIFADTFDAVSISALLWKRRSLFNRSGIRYTVLSR
jgi:hypothetical protein